jgi:hypothetical protein
MSKVPLEASSAAQQARLGLWRISLEDAEGDLRGSPPSCAVCRIGRLQCEVQK